MSRSKKVRATFCMLALYNLVAPGADAESIAGTPGREANVARPAAGPNVLFIVIDTLRADHLGAYGYGRPTSPNIDALAASGVRFRRVRSQASWTKPSMASIWTSLHPSSIGVQRFSHSIPERAVMPAEIFRDAGYRTAGLWRNGWVAPTFGFGQGFDLYINPPAGDALVKRGSNRPLPTDRDLTRSASAFLRTFHDQPFFLYVHYMDVHQYVYDGDSALFGTRYLDAYDNAIHWVDSNVGTLLSQLQKLGLREQTLIALAADHGEAFGEHGSEGHGRNLFAEVTHTPLILSQPGRLPRGVVVDQPVQNIDLWPTLFDLLGRAPLPKAQGRSLVAAIASGNQPKPATHAQDGVQHVTFSQLDRSWGMRGETSHLIASMTSGNWRLIHPVYPRGDDRLYDLARDPGEQSNLAQTRAGLVANMRDRIEAMLDRTPAWGEASEVDLDPQQLKELRALGYLGVGGDPSGGATTATNAN